MPKLMKKSNSMKEMLLSILHTVDESILNAAKELKKGLFPTSLQSCTSRVENLTTYQVISFQQCKMCQACEYEDGG